MKTVNFHEAKTNLLRLLKRVEAGEEILIAKAGTPVTKLTSVLRELPQKRVLGKDRGKVWISDDFDGLLPEDILKAFGN